MNSRGRGRGRGYCRVQRSKRNDISMGGGSSKLSGIHFGYHSSNNDTNTNNSLIAPGSTLQGVSISSNGNSCTESNNPWEYDASDKDISVEAGGLSDQDVNANGLTEIEEDLKNQLKLDGNKMNNKNINNVDAQYDVRIDQDNTNNENTTTATRSKATAKAKAPRKRKKGKKSKNKTKNKKRKTKKKMTKQQEMKRQSQVKKSNKSNGLAQLIATKNKKDANGDGSGKRIKTRKKSKRARNRSVIMTIISMTDLITTTTIIPTIIPTAIQTKIRKQKTKVKQTQKQQTQKSKQT